MWASCDMSRAYTEAIKHHCPNVTLVIDRFHVVKALNQAVDEVRKEEWVYPGFATKIRQKFISLLLWNRYLMPSSDASAECGQSVG